jgi:DNA helicase II / ATP-dependent DNA helicase PcrA
MTQLNSDQMLVLREHQGPRVVLAGPGSGKTTTMVTLIRWLVDDGVMPCDIRAVTFTKEMATALEKKLGVKGVASTFHSLGYSICSQIDRKPVEPELRFRLMVRLCKKWRLDYHDLDQFIAQCRRDRISVADASNNLTDLPYSLCMAYVDYEAARKEEGWMDFDSMLADAVQLLEQPAIRARWQARYLIVDEAQDTDNLQWRMMQLMSEKYGNITVVGDPGQAIYAFRGAKPENITNFNQWFPQGRYYYLGRNYRSTPQIVTFVRENVPASLPPALVERMLPARTDQGSPIRLRMYWQDEDEAEAALTHATKDPTHSIILARTNHWVGLLQRVCGRHNVRYHLLGKTSFWKQAEIRRAVDALKSYPTLSLGAALNLVLPDLIRKYAVDDRTERDNDAIENLKSLRDYEKGFRMAKDFATYANKMMHRRNDPTGVTISTVHQAKGGEWKNVFIVGASAKGFPHPKGEPFEERRIFYVAVSRAIDRLRISFSGTPSPYLRRYLTDDILDKLREKATEVDRLQAQHKLFN